MAIAISNLIINKVYLGKLRTLYIKIVLVNSVGVFLKIKLEVPTLAFKNLVSGDIKVSPNPLLDVYAI